MALRLVMMGTGEFALPAFLGLCGSRHAVVGLFTQPDRVGKGHHRHPHPMKEAALERGIPVVQPHNVYAPEALRALRSLDADLCVVAAYGQILSGELISIPRLGAINLHASLLPKYRGAAPVQYAVLKGEQETGVTIFQIEPKLDAGPILAVARLAIGPKETAGELETRLAELSVAMTLEVVDQLEAGTATRTFQDSSQVTKAPRLTKQDGLVDWSRPANQIEWQVRGMQPWPTAFTFLQRADGDPLRLILLDVDVAALPIPPDAKPGTVLGIETNAIVVCCGEGALAIRRLQSAGKKPMSAEEFLRGYPMRPDDVFVSSGE